LSREITKILSRPDIKESWEKQGASPLVMPPRQFGSYVEQQIDKWGKVVTSNNMKIE